MSDKHQSDRYPLPPELAAVEKQLAGLGPAAPRVDRDRLMFEAGRAAAEAELSRVEPVTRVEPSPSPSRKGRGVAGWFWPAATATMTAATILLSVMLARQDRQLRAVQLAGVQNDHTTTEAPMAAPSIERGNDDSLMLSASRDLWALQDGPTSGYLGVRRVALTQGIDALAGNLRPAVIGPGGDDASSQPPTARELLNEMLPKRSPSRSSS